MRFLLTPAGTEDARRLPDDLSDLLDQLVLSAVAIIAVWFRPPDK
jgi:hypothetical protein